MYCCCVLWQMLCNMLFGILHALANVIAKCQEDVTAMLYVQMVWPVLLSKVSDVLAMLLCMAGWQIEWPPRVGEEALADVIAISGRWNRHWVIFLF